MFRSKKERLLYNFETKTRFNVGSIVAKKFNILHCRCLQSYMSLQIPWAEESAAVTRILLLSSSATFIMLLRNTTNADGSPPGATSISPLSHDGPESGP